MRETLGDSILLSGGLDTSIITAVVSSILGADEKENFRAFTVVLEDAPSPDLGYSELVSKHFQIRQKVHAMNFQELEEALPDVIRVLRTFDPMEIRNSVAVYVGMKQAKFDGRSKIMTGDASDELFAGYSFVFRQTEEKARESLLHLWEVMHFSSIPLAASLGMEARLPFLHPGVKELASSSIDYAFLTGKRKDSDELFGKYILRRAFEDMLPPEITWRTKTPIEHGSGTTVLPKWYSESIRDSEFVAKKEMYLENDGVRLRDKEQLKYYEIYRSILGPPVTKDKNRRACPACTSNVPDSSTFCTTCGEYPI
ncbi:MAG: asparagine synthase C-terminal domain-containing protein [Thaumarchaeota archaeon]|nr:asparagine synthase C-terminal domain-containing protein [Nitrososphaerota archaeon]